MIASHFKVLVLGGGPAGLAVAVHLRQRAPVSILVAEADGGPQERIGETVPPDILLPLHRLKLASRFRDAGHLACPGSVSTWGRSKPGHNDFILNPLGPAWHLNRPRFEGMLADRALQAGAALEQHTRFVSATSTADGFDVLLRHPIDGDRRTHADWIIDATGSSARFARQQGSQHEVHDRMLAIARFARLRSGSFPAQTMLEATKDGWWYGARLPEDRLVTMFVTEYEDVQNLSEDGYASWLDGLRATTLLGPHLAECELSDVKFHRIPVLSSILDRMEGDRWLAIGDAASCYDPISSQGIYKALIDAADAAAHLAAGLGFGEVPAWGYSDRVRDRFRDYIANRNHHYGLEQRWPESRFWRRRAEAIAPVAGRGVATA